MKRINKDRKRVVSIALTLFLVLGLLPFAFSNASAASDDISDMLTNISIDLYYEDIDLPGSFIYIIKDNEATGNQLKQYQDNLIAEVSWELPEAAFYGNVAEGDFFEIALPLKTVLSAWPTPATIELMDDYTEEVLGIWYIDEDMPIHLEITEKGAEQLSLEGTFKIYCSTASLAHDTVEISVGGMPAISVPTNFVEYSEGPLPYGDNYAMDYEYYGSYVGKYGSQVGYGDTLTWGIFIDDFGNFDYYNNDSKVSAADLTVRDGVYIEDELEGEQEYDVDSLRINTLLYRPNKDGKLTAINVGWYNMLGLFTEITAEDEADSAKRMADLKAGQYGDGTYGFSDDKKHFVIYFGTFPSDKYTYDKLARADNALNEYVTYDDLKALLDATAPGASPPLTSEEIEAMVAVYGSGNGIDGMILTNNGISYSTTVISAASPLQNNTNYGYDGTAPFTGAYTVILKDASGTIKGLPPGTAELIKKDADTKVLIEGAVFKLQKQGVEDSWSDYGEGTAMTDEHGKVSFSSLGNGIYRFVEVTPAEGYDLTSAVYTPETFTIESGENGVLTTCTNEKIKESLTVNKAWEGDNPAGHPSSVQVQLYKDAVPEGDPVTLNAENSWSHTWSGLAAGAAWTVGEPNVPDDYTSTGAVKGEGDAYTITNTYDPGTPDIPDIPEPETTSLTVNKAWDGDNPAGHPSSVQVQLYKDDIPEGDPVTLNSRNSWSYTWDGLDEDATWTVDETNVPDDYTSTGAIKGEGDAYTITNTYAPGASNTTEQETAGLTVKKVWEGDNPAGHPASAQMQLKRNGVNEGAPVTLNAGNSWSYTWDSLDEGDAWTVDEVNVAPHYHKSAAVKGNGDIYTITNTYTQVAKTRPDTTSTDPKTPSSTEQQTDTTPGDSSQSGDRTNQTGEQSIEQPPVPNVPGRSVQPVYSDGGEVMTYIEFDDEGVPLGEWHWDEPAHMWLFDEYPPLGDLPRTGDDGVPLYVFLLIGISLFGIILAIMGAVLRNGINKMRETRKAR